MSQESEGVSDPHPIWYLVIFVAAGLTSVAIALFVKGGIGDIERLQERKQTLMQNKKEHRKRLRKLRQRQKRLHQDPYLIEKLARQKLGLHRPGEKIIRLRNQPDSSATLKSRSDRENAPNSISGKRNE